MLLPEELFCFQAEEYGSTESKDIAPGVLPATHPSPFLEQANKLKRTQGEADSIWAPTPICHLRTRILSMSLRGRGTSRMLAEKQDVLFGTDGGSPASTWLSGSRHPSIATQQAAHEELLR